MLTQLELFAGIGGFGLAGHWAGIKTVCQVEIDPFCQKVLQKNFPNAKRYADVKKFDGKPWRGTVDIISGGFPCQPYSSAGKRLGKEDERHLWPEMLRIIREVRPRWIVGENVFGLVNWSGGLVFDEVQSDLESEGYEVQAFVLPAAGVNAPHERNRIWFISYAGKTRRKEFGSSTFTGDMGFPSWRNIEKWNEWTLEPPICGVDDGVPERLDKNRNKRIGALGNAIVPQVAYQVFKSIMEYEKVKGQHNRDHFGDATKMIPDGF